MKYEKSCGSVVYRFNKKNKLEFLLIQHKNGYHWDFPKGHVEASEKEDETAIREVFEETALRVNIFKNTRQQILYTIKNKIIKEVIYFLSISKNNSNNIKVQKSEILDYKWLEYEFAYQKLTYEKPKKLLKTYYAFLLKKYKLFEEKENKIYDITPLISNKIKTYSGDMNFNISKTKIGTNKNTINISNIKTTVHLGAHVDFPSHYSDSKIDAANDDLSLFFGHSQVITVIPDENNCINMESLKNKICSHRVLLKTNSFLGFETYNTNFAYLGIDALEYLNKNNVKLIGIDTPSIDKMDCEKIISHYKILEFNMRILEGIDLKNIKDGIYNLSALPLKIKGSDGSPVRAILTEIKEEN